MHRIDAPGFAPGNLFTEGNPSLGIPATEVSDDWLNDVQEEIVNIITAQGITLVKGTQTQLRSAIELMINNGGAAFTNFSIANNQAVAANITGLLFDKTIYKAVQVPFDLFRKTDSSNVKESGTLFITHNPISDTWDISLSSSFQDAGVTFSVTSAGQVQYVSTNIAGTSYVGTFRAAGILRFKQ